jgi:signal transduction histidine kinase
MFQSLKIAVKRQKKLLVIFFITIFLPSVVLSIFGIIALRNEKFRVEKEIENEQLRIANAIKERIKTRFIDIEEKLKILSGYPAFRQKDSPAIKELITNMFERDSLVDVIFILYQDEDPVFPMFQALSGENNAGSYVTYNIYLQQQIKNAEDAEYVRNDYLSAASIYNNAFLESGNRTIKARMLNLRARNLMKAARYREASEVYSMIINNYPDERTGSDLPLGLYAKMQKTECHKLLGEKSTAAGNDLDIFEELILGRWNLNENRFRTYSSIITERLTELFSDTVWNSSGYLSRFEKLGEQYCFKVRQWETIDNIISYIVPDLPAYLSSGSSSSTSFDISKRVGNENYLIEAVTIPSPSETDNNTILAAKLNNQYLQNNTLDNAISAIQALSNTSIQITSISGDSIKGTRSNSPEAITTTALFDDNFPPWRMELAYISPGGIGEINIFSNFFFWTIITLIIILVFGAALLARIVAHEMEILKIKSDFVSSVSHEFKTPLTSMKSLTERLGEGKVTESSKMKQYISILASDIDRLTHLVSNILSFSKIEEGKKIYKKERTDIATWLKEVIENYKKESVEREFTINYKPGNNLPALNIDRDSMAQVMFNLFDNASKFSRGEKEAEVTTESKDHSVIIKVKDKGIGIRDDEKDKIFEKFYRGESAVKYLIKGTGLGLALVKHTVEAHGGTIEVESEPGKGSSFTVKLPITDT